MFRGAWTALATPFRRGDLDEDALIRLVERQIEGGIHGLVPCGTTGEAPGLSTSDHVRVVKTVLAAAKNRVPVLVGASSNCTREAVNLAHACREAGATATLQITPYYNRPTQSGLIAHFTQIADEVGLPVVLYNVPKRTGIDLLPDTVGTLARHPKIVGIKDATANMDRAAKLRECCGPNFALLSGDDLTVFPFLAVAGDGVISVTSNVVPTVFAKMCDAAQQGRWDEARALHYEQLPLTRALMATSNPILLKAALARMGLMGPELRLPLEPVDDDDPLLREVEDELRRMELV